eukprot:1715232-Ditylum_brightwellii.AAC.1
MIEGLVDQSLPERSKFKTKVNNISVNKTKDDIMSCLDNGLSEVDYKFAVPKNGSTPLIHGIFSKLADILSFRTYNQWYQKMIGKAPWIL